MATDINKILTDNFCKSILNKSLLSLRIDKKINDCLNVMLKYEHKVIENNMVKCLWYMYLSKNGYNKTKEYLNKLKIKYNIQEYYDLYCQTLSLCGHDEEELDFLLNIKLDYPWVKERIIRNSMRTNNKDLFYETCLKEIKNNNKNLKNLIIDCLWALGDYNFYFKYRSYFYENNRKFNFYEEMFSSYKNKIDRKLKFNIIYIPDDEKRLNLTISPLSIAQIDYDLFEGLDGSKLPDIFTKYMNLQKGTIGVACSHLRLWEKLMTKKEKGLFIIENDAALTHNVGDLSNLVKGYDFVFFNDRSFEKDIFSYDLKNFKINTYIPPRGTIGADGYYISKNFANYLLDKFCRDGIMNHIDVQIFRYMREEYTYKNFKIGRTSFPVVRHYPLGFGRRRVIELNY